MFLDNVCKILGINIKSNYLFFSEIVRLISRICYFIISIIVIVLFIISLIKKKRRLYSFLNIIKYILIMIVINFSLGIIGILLDLNMLSYGNDNYINCKNLPVFKEVTSCSPDGNCKKNEINYKEDYQTKSKLIFNSVPIIILLPIIILIIKEQKKINLQE